MPQPSSSDDDVDWQRSSDSVVQSLSAPLDDGPPRESIDGMEKSRPRPVERPPPFGGSRVAGGSTHGAVDGDGQLAHRGSNGCIGGAPAAIFVT